MRYKITAPARGFNGEVAGVVFSGGRAVADSAKDSAALGYFRRKGYTVVEAGTNDEAEDIGFAEEPATEDAQTTPGRPARSEPKAVWQEYARGLAQDSDETAAIDGMTKDQLIEKYGSAERAGQQGETA